MNGRGMVERFLEKYDPLLYGALFLAALLLRISAVESAPLSGREAAEAWGAWNLLHGGASSSTGALYSSLTAGLLFLAGPSHWVPRLLPALAGALAVLLPRILIPERGRAEPFLTALLIALSPSIWISSVLAGGPVIGLAAAGFCILYLRSKQPRPLLSGAALGLAVASGPAGWSGLAIAAAVLAVDAFLRPKTPDTEGADAGPMRNALGAFLRTPAGPAGFLLALAAGSTGLFFFPRGLGALTMGFSDWLGAFLSGPPRLGELILLLTAYDPAALVFGAAGIVLAVRGMFSGRDRFYSRFAAAAAVWVLIRPSAFPDEALWVILPLLVLAAGALHAAWEYPPLAAEPAAAVRYSLAVLAAASFTALDLAAFESTGNVGYLVLPPLLIAAVVLAYLLYRGDWRNRPPLMLCGSVPGMLAVLCALQIGAGWNGAHVRRTLAGELWAGETAPADLLRLRDTIEQISTWQTGVADELAVVVQLPEESALGWELLSYGAAEYAATLDVRSAPPMLITPYTEQEGVMVTPQLAAAYRGQAFAVTERRAWSGWPPDFFGWWLYREGPVERDRVVLWVRSDILIPEEGAQP